METKKIKSYSAKDILEMEFPTLVSIENEMIVFHEYHKYNKYEVELNRIKTRAQLLGWVHHMAEKAWVSGETIAQFIEVVCKYYGWNIYDTNN